MSERKPDPNCPEFASMEAIRSDIEAFENNEAAATPEWFVQALMSAWQDGQLKGNADGYFGTNTARNPFMTDAEKIVWYGDAA